MKIDISGTNATLLYEDDQIFALSKPSGLHTLAQLGSSEASLGAALIAANPLLEQAGRAVHDAGLLQRLDLETSGIILGAKNSNTWRALHEILSEPDCKKNYVYISDGAPTIEPSTVEGFIGGRYRNSKRVTFSEEHKERFVPCSTIVTPVVSSPTRVTGLVKAELVRGRRHQIRATAQHIGFYLLGDSLYGSERTLLEVVGIEREFFLHATSITFRHPADNRPMLLSAPLDTRELEMLAQHFELDQRSAREIFSITC